MKFKKKKIKTITITDKPCGSSAARLRELGENQEKMLKQFGGPRKKRVGAAVRSYPATRRPERDLNWLVKD